MMENDTNKKSFFKKTSLYLAINQYVEIKIGDKRNWKENSIYQFISREIFIEFPNY